MRFDDVKALTFDTGGTILDWHAGFSKALSDAGAVYGIERDWSAMSNEIRRRSLGRMLSLGEFERPRYNFDDAHQMALDEVLSEFEFTKLDGAERREIWWKRPHSFECWLDFPSVLPKLRAKYICASFTILSFRIVIDTARRNGLLWDAVISCEAIGKYKPLPEAYENCARYLQLEPAECCMVACHNFDLVAAKASGFRTAFVRRPHEWGPAGPPDPEPNPAHDIIVDDFLQLAAELGVTV